MGIFLRRKKSKTDTQASSGAATPKRRLSAQLEPGNSSSNNNPRRSSFSVRSSTLSHLRPSSSSINNDRANTTAPPRIYTPKALSPPKKTSNRTSQLTPEIHPVRHRQSKGLFSLRKTPSHDTSSSSVSEDQTSRTHFFLTNEVPSTQYDSSAVVGQTTNGTVESLHSRRTDNHLRPPNNTGPLDASSDQGSLLDRERERDKESDQLEPQHSGILSTFMSAAHTAATHIGSIAGTTSTDVKFHPTENGKADESGGNFMQHLDSLLSFNGKNSSQTQQPIEPPEQPEDNEVFDQTSQTSRAQDVKFEPVRKTLLSTMGKGELTLEDLGFVDMPTTASVNGVASPPQHVPPQIEVENPSMSSVTASPIHSPSPTRTASPLLSKDSKLPRLNSVLSNQPLEKVKSYDPNMTGRQIKSTSPPPFRRSLSPRPNRFLLTDGTKRPQPRRAPSAHTLDHNSVTGDISFDTGLSRSSTYVELKNVTFASAKRNADFHSIFKKISKSERLIDDYSCALQREIMVQGRMLINEKMLVQGRMYISERNISFKSNILGWVTTLSIPIQEIVQLEKKTTAGLFPNAIVIQTLHQKYIFASLLNRDTTFDLITNIWNQIVRGTMEDSVEDERGRRRSISVGSRLAPSDSEGYTEDDDYDYDDDTEDDDGDDFEREDEPKAEDDDIPNISKHAPTEPEHQEVPGEVKIIEETVSAPLPKVYRLLFGKSTEFMTRVITKQKNKNISAISEFTNKNDVMTREYNYIKPLSAPVGPKETRCQVVETLDHVDFKEYIKCTQTTRTPDVPSGNAFSVVTNIYLSWGPRNSTTVLVYTHMNWTGKSWIKSAIDNGSISGQKESIGILVNELKSEAATTESSGAGADSSEEAVSSLPLIGPKTHPSVNFTPTVPSPESIILEEEISAPLGVVYNLLFGAVHLKHILEAQKVFDISQISEFPAEGEKKRSYNYTKPLNAPVGPKTTKCDVTETVEQFDLNSVIHIQRIINTPDVPSGNAFHVSANYWLSWGENNCTKVVSSTGVVWKGKSWIKSMIEKGSIDGQKESNKVMIQEVKDIIARDAASSGKKRKRGKTVTQKKPEVETCIEELGGKPGAYYNLNFPGAELLQPFNNVFGLFGVAFVLWLVFKRILGGAGQPTAVSVGADNRVTIGGREYILMPAVDDRLKSDERIKEQEYEIWKWIESRSGDGKELNGAKKPEVEDKLRAHKQQNLREMLKVAESHLEELLSELDESENPVKDIL